MADNETVIRPPESVTVMRTRPVIYDAYGTAYARVVGFHSARAVQTGGQFPQLQRRPPKRKGGKKGG